MTDMMIELGPENPANELCDSCGLRKWWHDQNSPEHPFRSVGDKGERFKQDQPPPPTPIQLGDPIARVALIRAGVLTEMQLTEAEAWVREASRQGKALVVTHEGFELVEVEVVAKEVGESARG